MAGEGYNVGGRQFMSSALAKAASPGGYSRTTYYPGGNPYYTGPRTSLTSAARSAFGKAIKQFEPGGGYGKGIEAALERGRTKAVAGGQQALVSAGLAGTSMMAAPGLRFEEEVAMPTRAKVEETRATQLADLYAMLAQTEQQGYETMLGRETRFPQMMPQLSMPAVAPITTGNYGYRGKDISDPFSNQPILPNRISSALANIPPIGSPADLWRKGMWGQSLEAERMRAGIV